MYKKTDNATRLLMLIFEFCMLANYINGITCTSDASIIYFVSTVNELNYSTQKNASHHPTHGEASETHLSNEGVEEKTCLSWKFVCYVFHVCRASYECSEHKQNIKTWKFAGRTTHARKAPNYFKANPGNFIYILERLPLLNWNQKKVFVRSEQLLEEKQIPS